MNTKNNISEDLANGSDSKSMQNNLVGQEDSKSQEENDSDSEWETQSESESFWSPSDSEWSIAGDTESDSNSEDEELITTPSLQDWSDDIRSAKVCAFKLKPGLKESCGKTPVDFFNMLFTRPLFEFLVNNINSYARKIVNQNQPGRRFKEVTVNEFHVFFGLLLNIGNTSIFDTLFSNEPIDNPEEFMSEGRFEVILKCLNFEHMLPGNQDKMSKISHMIEYFNIMMKKVVHPEKILCIEESIHVPCHEHVFILADQSGLALKLVVSQAEEKAGPHVAKSLLDDKLDVGHSVYMDECYNTLELTKFLLDRNTYVTGPLKRKRLGKLKEVTRKEVKKGEKVTKYNSDGICVTKGYDRREIIIVSSEHGGEWVEYIDKRKVTVNKPACILEYKKYRDSVEKHNDMIMKYYFHCGEKANKYKRIGVHILQILVLNAHILHNRYGGKYMKLLEFRKVIAKHLLSHKRVRV